MASSFKKTKVKLDLLTDTDMLLTVEKGIRGGICHYIYRYAKAKNKHTTDSQKNKESSYLKEESEGCQNQVVIRQSFSWKMQQ